MTEDKLYELDRDDLIKELENKLEITISEELVGNADLYIDSLSTADGYEIYAIYQEMRYLNTEYDLFYYEPSAEEILNRLEELDSGDKVYITDMEILSQDENAIIDYLMLNFSDEYDEINEIIEESGE